MTDPMMLNLGQRCERFELPTYNPSEQQDGWCSFCRCYTGEATIAAAKIWRLRPDKSMRRCTPAQLGSWESTGRDVVASNLMDLRDGTSATLTTMFLCVDYWPDQGEPMLFETRLHEMDTGASYDRCTRRYATYAAAKAGHVEERERLLACDAVIYKG